MIEFTMMRHADRDIEYRITEVEKSASIDEEKVKQELYDALRDKKKVIEDLREQLAFRNSALEHEITQRQLLEDDRRNLVLRLEEAICTGPSVILSSEETQTPRVSQRGAGVQTLPGKRAITRTTHTQTWDSPQIHTGHKGHTGDHLTSQVKKLQDQLGEMRKQQTVIEKSYEKRLTDLRVQHARTNDSLSKTHFSQEQLLGNTVLQLQEENIQLREQVSLANNRTMIISSDDSDDFNQSGFCCAPGVRKKKKKKKKKGKSDDIPNPYGLHSSEKQAAFWNGNNGNPTGSEI